jgi:cysteine desulfurase/selenocysteine lyase
VTEKPGILHSPSATAGAPAATETPADFDVRRWRADFPILDQKVNGKPLVYLDNAASSQHPRQVIDAISEYYEKDHSNVHRGVHSLSQRATFAYERARAKVKRFLNAPSDKEIIFTRGATEAVNLVADSYGRAFLEAGDEILVTAMEHHANIVPWQLLGEKIGTKLVPIPMSDAGELDMDAFHRLLTDKVKLVAVVWVSNALGTVNPVEEIIAAAHGKGIPVLIDAAQAVPHMPVDVQALDCEFLVFSGHKMFAPTGIGVLYGKRELLEKMPPWQGGGDMIDLVTFEKTTFNTLPFKFEAGTPHIAGAIGLGAAIDYMMRVGIENIARHEHQLLEYATREIRRIPGVRIIGTAARKASVLSFIVDDMHSHTVGEILDKEGVAVRVGHHCAQPVMQHFGISATTRASLAFYNTREDVDAFIAALRKAIHFRRSANASTLDRLMGETIDNTQQRIIDAFADYVDWEERYRKIIELGETIGDIPEEYKIEKYRVRGCQSTVYLHASLNEQGRVLFKATSDAEIVRGLIALLLQLYSNRTPDEIIATQPRFITEIGLSDNLSQGRANGLAAMIEQMKLYALAFQTMAKARSKG